jgi:hypothetical protein
VPEEVFGEPTVAEIWELAQRFRDYEYLFSARAWTLRRKRLPPDSDTDGEA